MAKLTRDALESLLAGFKASSSSSPLARALQQSLDQWVALANQAVATGKTASPAGSGASQPTPSAGASSPRVATTNPYARSALAFNKLPATMRGGVAANGAKVIYVTDVSQLALLPLWQNKAGGFVDQYSQQFLDALKSGKASVATVLGYEIHINEAKPPPAPKLAFGATDAQLKDFVLASLSNPGSIASAMRLYGISFERVGRATGYTAAQIADYVRDSKNPALTALYAASQAATPVAPAALPAVPVPAAPVAPTPTTPAPTTPAPTTPAHPYSQSALAYSALPASMQGGVSPNNGLQVIYVTDESQIALLPMWKDKLPGVVEFYSQLFLDAIRSGNTSVTGTMGYEIHFNQAKPAAPTVTDAQIKDFVTANLASPGNIAAAMRQYGVSFARLSAATGYTATEIADYVRNSGNADLIALYAASQTSTPTPVPTTPVTPAPTTPAPTTPAHPYSQSALAYSQLPVSMQGGVSPNNGMPIIYVTDESQIALLPLWKDKPAAFVDSYSRQLLETLRSGNVSVTGYMGYEIHINQTKPAAPVPATPAAPTTPAPTTPAPAAPAHPYSQSALAYSQLPASMQGGVSPNNAMPIIYVTDESQIALLPLWKDKPAAFVDSYSRQLLETLRSGNVSVTGYMGYEIHINQAKPTTPVAAPVVPTPAVPSVTDADIKAFVVANLSNPGSIAAAMRQYGVSFARLSTATGYTPAEIADYVRNSGNADLIALYAASHP